MILLTRIVLVTKACFLCASELHCHCPKKGKLKTQWTLVAQRNQALNAQSIFVGLGLFMGYLSQFRFIINTMQCEGLLNQKSWLKNKILSEKPA